MTVVSSLTQIDVIPILVKIQRLESSTLSNKYMRIVDLLDSTQSNFNKVLDMDRHFDMVADHVVFSETGSELWQNLRNRYNELADE